MAESQDAIPWLDENGYPAVAEKLRRIQAGWKERGAQTRRSWWVKLAGKTGGRPCAIEGEELPVLRAAQIRMGRPVTSNALWHPGEVAPPKRETGRWKKKRKARRRRKP
jgi:hypothetical protein